MTQDPPTDAVPFPSSETLEVVRLALVRHITGSISKEELCAALRRLADEAQARHLRAEEMLVVFKDLWHSLPEVRRITDRGERGRLLAKVVSLCIEVYYSR